MSWTATTPLYQHQQQAVATLQPGRVGALFMDMGTGKTRTAIELVCLRQQRISRVIWYCPVSAKFTVRNEILKHTTCDPASIYVFDDHTNPRTIPLATFWHIVGIESMSSSDRVTLTVGHLIDEQTCIILDESSYIKGYTAIRTQRITLLAEKARYRLLLSGTPISQGVQDLYAQMRFLSPDILGYKSFYSFAANHLVYSDRFPGVVVNVRNEAYIAAQIAPYTYQVKKDECLDLPKKTYKSWYVDMTNDQRSAYDQAKNEILLECDLEEIDSITIFRLFTALQQIVCGYWNRRPPDQKSHEFLEYPQRRLDVLRHVLEGMPKDEKIIVWSKYRHCLDKIMSMMQDAWGTDQVAVFHGGLNEKQRHQQLELFRGPARLLIATPSCGGYALNLTEASQVVFYTNGFKYGDRMQAEDRCHRHGQTRPVMYHDIICNQSIDERIEDALSRKENVVVSFRRALQQLRDKPRSELRNLVAGL